MAASLKVRSGAQQGGKAADLHAAGKLVTGVAPVALLTVLHLLTVLPLLQDTDSIVNTLEFGIGFLLHFIFAAIYLLVWGMDM